MKNLLESRKKTKASKPTFVRQAINKKSRLAPKWRRPKGLQSKLRLCKGGHSKRLSQGYRSPVAVRGTDRSGLRAIRISNVADLAAIDVKTEGIVVSGKVGMRKRAEIIKQAQEKNITILNVKDADSYLSAVSDNMKKRQDARRKREAKAVSAPKKTKKTDDKKAEVKTEETGDAEESAKKEKDKLLTKRTK